MQNKKKSPADVEDARAKHEAAVYYNDEFVKFAQGLAERIDHPVVKKWVAGIGRQHEFHRDRHQKALDKLEGEPAERLEELVAEAQAAAEEVAAESTYDPARVIEMPNGDVFYSPPSVEIPAELETNTEVSA